MISFTAIGNRESGVGNREWFKARESRMENRESVQRLPASFRDPACADLRQTQKLQGETECFADSRFPIPDSRLSNPFSIPDSRFSAPNGAQA